MNWYEWGSVVHRLLTFGRAIQGVSPYRVVLDPDPWRCPAGYCDYHYREIAVNPQLFPKCAPKVQYRLTQALLVHEAGHRRFTTPSQVSPVIHGVFNLLEDERVERLMATHFAGLGHLLVRLSAQMLTDLPALNPTSEQPVEILNTMLRLRWAERAGVAFTPVFSEVNAKRWKKVEPLMRQAWVATTSAEVETLATEIAKILDLHELPDWLRARLNRLGPLVGERAEDDAAETGTIKPGEGDAKSAPDDNRAGDKHCSGVATTTDDPDLDGMLDVDDHPAGHAEQTVTPAPYLQLVAQLQPLVEELVAELAWTPKNNDTEYHARGQRLAVREYLRQPETPFRVPAPATRQPPALGLRVLIDHSTSMNKDGRMQAARLGTLLVHLVATRLNIPHEIALTPNDIRLANLTTGERGLALLAGIKGATSYEGIDVTLDIHARELLASKVDHRVILILHDGYPDNPNKLQTLCRALRGQVEVIGLGLEYDDRMADALGELFGSDRLILCKSATALPKKLGTLLRTIYGK